MGPCEEGGEQVGAVLHPPEPGLDQGGELGEGALDQVARDRFSSAQADSTGLSSEAYEGSWKTVSQSRATTSSRITPLTWVVKSVRGAVSVLSTGPFPVTASRTRRACLRAPGAPQALSGPARFLIPGPATEMGWPLPGIGSA